METLAPAVTYKLTQHRYPSGLVNEFMDDVQLWLDGVQVGVVIFANAAYLEPRDAINLRKRGLIEPGEFYIKLSLIEIQPTHRGHKLAKPLYDYFEQVCRERGAKGIILETKDRDDNNLTRQQLKAMYQSWGFAPLYGKMMTKKL